MLLLPPPAPISLPMPADARLAGFLGHPSQAELIAELSVDERRERIAAMPASLAHSLGWHWPFWARPAQREPSGVWRTWLVMAGRGFGKTRLGSEWVRSLARHPDARIALVAATYAEARSVMVEGAAGVLALHPPHERPRFDPSLRRLEWANGATAHLYSASEPEGLRGPEHTHAWGDELAKWPMGESAWAALGLTVRVGRNPRMLATTTPRPVSIIRRLVADAEGRAGPQAINGGRGHQKQGLTRLTRGGTAANRGALAPGFLHAMAEHADTRLARQELDGELLDELDEALWSRALLARSRTVPVGPLVRTVVGVDPPTGIDGDACGIVVCGVDAEGRGVVLEDASVHGLTPAGWAGAVAAAARVHKADRVVAEANQGGEMVRSVLQSADWTLPIRLVRASVGKLARAEPISALYERGLVRHQGELAGLEDELTGFVPGGWDGSGSPDRADAMIWALTDLMLGRRGEPSIRML